MKLSKIADFVIEYSFYLLFFFVPIIWLPMTSELFEFNKFILLLLLTIVIITAWILKILSERQLNFKRTALDIPIVLFLIANILSTIFSLDPHTSIWGYYGRWNAGLISVVAYSLLYYALVNNSDKKQIYYYLATSLISGFLISIYALLQHPNPLFTEKVNGQTIWHGIDYKYWAVDVQNRVFSTLGQPNWLSALLAMLILPLLSLFFIFKKIWQQILLFVAFTVYYLAFTFTFSRGGLVGLLIGVLTFVVLFPFYHESLFEKVKKKIPFVDLSVTLNRLKEFLVPIVGIIVIIVIANQIFGNALALRGGLNSTKQTSTETTTVQTRQTQLEVGGSQTAQIRTIVWDGAVQTFKHYPIFGSGLETFGFSYYLFRPAAHNYTSEWDFLYNKAHNEFLNYLSSTGAVGILTYLLYIGAFEYFAILTIVRMRWGPDRFLGLGLLAGFNTALGANFFGFSVIPTNLLFYTFPAFFFIVTSTLKKDSIFKFEKSFSSLINNLNNNIAKVFVVLVSLWLFLSIVGYWTSDFLYSKSFGATDYQKSVVYLKTAVKLAPWETVYKTELASNYASLAAAINEEDKNSDEVKNAEKLSRNLIDQVSGEHPNDTTVWQSKKSIDYDLSKIDPKNNEDLEKTAEKLSFLAPTDASIQYDVALVYLYLNKNVHAQKQLEKVVALKNDYRDAVLQLARTEIKNNENEAASKLLQDWIKKNPDDSEASDLLKSLLTS